MNRAITLSTRARGMTSPNPMVGAVIVKNGKIIAEGYHRNQGPRTQRPWQSRQPVKKQDHQHSM